MSLLFDIDNKRVFPNPETLLIEPFKGIWNRDKSKGKEIAVQEFTYIEFMTSMLKSNPYREYPEDKKDKVIREDIITIEDWEPDSKVKLAMDETKRFQKDGSITYTYWMSNKAAVEKMKRFFEDFDMNERDPKSGRPIYKPKDITSAINDAEKILKTLNSLKKKVDEEVFNTIRNKSGKEISIFAKR